MSELSEKTLRLPAAEVDRIEALVESGAYPSTGAVIQEALIALEERNATLNDWLSEEVGPAYDEIEAHPDRVLTGDQVAENLRAHHENSIRKTA